MLKRIMGVAIALVLAMTAGPVAAQTCTVGAYADADGTSSIVVTPGVGLEFDVYVVLFAESQVDAVSYRLVAPGLGVDYFQTAAVYGPNSSGIGIDIGGGTDVGLGDCFVGFGGAPIVVSKLTFLQLTPALQTTMTVSGGNENPDFPVFSNCIGTLVTCESGPVLSVDDVVSTESASFGAVKSLFQN